MTVMLIGVFFSRWAVFAVGASVLISMSYVFVCTVLAAVNQMIGGRRARKL